MPVLPVVRMALIAGVALAGAALIPHALAQDVTAPETPQSIDFRDSAASFAGGAVNLSAHAVDERLAPADLTGATGDAPHQVMELQIAADHEHTGAPLDISFAQRGLIGADNDRQSTGSEVRVGRGLIARDDGSRPRRAAVYAFVASDNHALTWRPGARSEFGGAASALALQDQINIGDNSAGVTYEQDGIQASLAYVERSVATHVGNRGYSQDESFAGVTVTMRR